MVFEKQLKMLNDPKSKNKDVWNLKNAGSQETDYTEVLLYAFQSVKDSIEKNDFARIIFYTDGEGSLPDSAIEDI